MSYLMEDIKYLSQDIGPRPAGTEEERRAAMYIAENIGNRSGLNFNIEDFEGARGNYRALNICSIISAILIVVSSLLSVITIPAFCITLLAAIVMILELLGKPVLSGACRYGISQNVVAKYEPSFSPDNPVAQRKRKIVFVTRYDSSYAVQGNNPLSVSAPYYLRIISLITCCLIPLVLLIKIIAFSDTSGSLSLMFIIIGIVLAILAILPTLAGFVRSRMAYNEAANSNASGTAVLMELARLLGTGAFGAAAPDAQVSEPKVHGGKAAAASGLIPEGAEVKYDAKPNIATPKTGFLGDTTEYDDALVQKEQALSDAKAAVAAFSAPRKKKQEEVDVDMPTLGGKPDSADDANGNNQPVEDQAATASDQDSKDSSLQNITIDDASAVRAYTESSNVPSYETVSGGGEVPSWFKSAQDKAKAKNADEDKKPSEQQPVRSRFAHTMDTMAQRKEAEKQEIERQEEEKRAKLRAQIEAANLVANQKAEEEIGQQTPFFRGDGQDAPAKPAVQPNAPAEPVAETKPAEPVAETKPAEPVAEPAPAEPVAEPKTAEPTQVSFSFDNDDQSSLSLDERFKRRQMQANPSIKAAEPKSDDASSTTDTESSQASAPAQDSVLPQTESAQPVDAANVDSSDILEEGRSFEMPDEDVKDNFFQKATDKMAAIASENETPKAPSLRPQTSGAINLDQNKQYAPLDDANFVKTAEVEPNESQQAPVQNPIAMTGLPGFDEPTLGTDNQQANQNLAAAAPEAAVGAAAMGTSEVAVGADTMSAPEVGAADIQDSPTQAISEVVVQPADGSEYNDATSTPMTADSAVHQSVAANDGPAQASSDPHETGKFGTGSFKAVSQNSGIAGATGTFAPVTDELIAQGDVQTVDDMVVDDADDKAFTEAEFTDAGAFAGPGYVDMPKEKGSGIFGGLFGRKKNKHGKHGAATPNIETPAQAATPNIETPAQVDAPAQAATPNIDTPAQVDTEQPPRPLPNIDSEWEGGAFSNLTSKASSVAGNITSKVSAKKNEFSERNHGGVDEIPAEDPNIEATMAMPPVGASADAAQDALATDGFAPNQSEFDQGMNFDAQPAFNTPGPITSDTNKISTMVDAVPNFDEQIQEFHDGSINLEVWMVALGSEIDENAGIRNFLVEHAQDLRGAIIVDIEALGAGELSLIEGEGLIRRTNVSSRLKRYVRRAANKMGVAVPSVRVPWLSSAAAYANKFGFNAMKLSGMDGAKPAYYMQDDDTIDVVDEALLQENIKYLLKLIQSV